MRDRQPIGNIIQQEVIEATCSSAQVPTVALVVNNALPEPNVVIPNFYPGPSPGINAIQAGKIGKYAVFFL
jgi:hypothetical protein